MDIPGLQKELGLRGVIGRWVAGCAYRVLCLGEFNRIQAKYCDYSGAEFATKVLKEVGVSYQIPENQLERIPKEGGFILVSNHHFGSIDGLILESAVGSLRPDLKILTTFVLTLIPGLADSFIPVNNFSSGTARSVKGIRAALEHMAGGHPLALFAAGEVATLQRRKNRTSVGGRRVVEDIPWAENIIKMVKRSGLPVIPVYFEGGNSRLFHFLGRIHPRLRTVRLPREMLNKRGLNVRVRIGHPIAPGDIAGMDIPVLGKYLRNLCYSLEVQCRSAQISDTKAFTTPVADPVPAGVVREEMERLEDKVLFESGDYRLYLIRTPDAPNAMRELYRLREVTFRRVGEGTGHSEDTDVYDDRYYHLLLWNIPDGEIAGAYRIGDCSEVMAAHGGIQGIYTASLYRYNDNAAPILSRSMELGRSFVVPKYQREVHPLRLLLGGLTVSSLRMPGANYYLGPVSISNDYPAFYKSLIVYFLKREFSLAGSEDFVAPTHPFVPDYLAVNPEDLLAAVPPGDIDRFDRLLAYISDGEYRLPVLVRKYFNCSARLACFNVDPDFNDSLDGLIFLRLDTFPVQTLRSILRGAPDETREKVLEHFYGISS